MLPVPLFELTRNEHRIHIVAMRKMHDDTDRIVEGQRINVISTDQHDVGFLTGCKGTDLVRQCSIPRAPDRRKLQTVAHLNRHCRFRIGEHSPAVLIEAALNVKQCTHLREHASTVANFVIHAQARSQSDRQCCVERERYAVTKLILCIGSRTIINLRADILDQLQVGCGGIAVVVEGVTFVQEVPCY